MVHRIGYDTHVHLSVIPFLAQARDQPFPLAMRRLVHAALQREPTKQNEPGWNIFANRFWLASEAAAYSGHRLPNDARAWDLRARPSLDVISAEVKSERYARAALGKSSPRRRNRAQPGATSSFFFTSSRPASVIVSLASTCGDAGSARRCARLWIRTHGCSTAVKAVP